MLDATRQRPGFLAVFEGIDGAGKSTQIRSIASYFTDRGYKVVTLREPTDGPHGRHIRSLSRNAKERPLPREEMALFLADRRWNVETNIVPALESGALVLVDRYYISSMAYQGALGIDPEEIRAANEAFAPKPNLILFFDLPPDTAMQRIRAGRSDTPDMFERLDNLRRVAKLFRSFQMPNLVRIDATSPEVVIAEQVRREFLSRLPLPFAAPPSGANSHRPS